MVIPALGRLRFAYSYRVSPYPLFVVDAVDSGFGLEQGSPITRANLRQRPRIRLNHARDFLHLRVDKCIAGKDFGVAGSVGLP